MKQETSNKPIIVVLGMHRSGTSLTARALQVLGVDLGDNLIPPLEEDNDKGFWEDIDINDFDNALLEKLGSAWDRLSLLDESKQRHKLVAEKNAAVSMIEDKMKSTGLFGFKDPRTVILLPFWQTVFQELGLDDQYVIAIRNPLNVAKSLLKRNAIPLEAGILLWAKHMSGVLRHTRGKCRVVVDYDLILESPSLQIRRIANVLSLAFDDHSQQRLDTFEKEFISTGLRHHTASLEELESSEFVPDIVKDAYSWMLKLANEEADFNDIELETFWQRFEDTCRSFDAGYQYMDRLAFSFQEQVDVNKKLFDKLLLEEQNCRTAEKVRDQVTDEMESIRQRLFKATNELSESKKMQQDLQLKLKHANEKNKKLSIKLQVEEQNCRAAEKVRDQVTDEMESIRQRLFKATNELSELKKIQQDLQLKLKHANDKNKKLSIKLQVEEQNCRAAEKVRDRVSDEMESIRLQLVQVANELDESRKLQSKYKALHQHAIAERDDRQRSYKELHKAFNQAVAERDVANKQVEEILHSSSWQLTRGLRAIRRLLMTLPNKVFRKYISSMLRDIWARLPVSPRVKSRLKRQLFTKVPFVFQHTVAYRNWQALEMSSQNTGLDSSSIVEWPSQDLSGDEKELYVPMRNDEALTELPVRLVAFYLPQFHAITENDEWWGEGFTEWTNVVPAKPQFKGHYQPHVPGELGYYDLTDPSVQKRQVELAKQFGVGGFCFYFYWFAGKRLLEAPVLNYLDDSSLDLPFCLCWANENWSRRWDGLDNDVLIGQQHSSEDDLAFIDYVSCYLRDPRYIRINGRPLLLVYRPSLLPSPKKTTERWRTWCMDNGIGAIYIAYTQSFETEDPGKYGFDAAVEFPPNNSGPPVITDQVEQLNPEFSGIVYDWRIFVERSKNYQQPDYPLFRSVTPSWDNTARRKSGGAIFANSSPEGYQYWLTRAIEDTLAHRERQDEYLVFVNAWNEWAEGAYLEPDEKYGYAYLQATRNALEHVVKEKGKRRIVLVIHDAFQHGAQYLILNMAKVLQESMGFTVDMIVLGEGPLIEEYRKYANVHELAGHDVRGKITVELIQKLHKQGSSSAITNTAVTGLIVPVLKQCGFTVVSLIHELPQLIKDYQLQDHVNAIANEADKVVFAATDVKRGFETFVKLDKTKVVIRPQGLYKKNSLHTTEQFQTARSELRRRFNLPEKAKIILGVGFADYRKGIDIFVESGIRVLNNNKNIYFLWLGNFESKIERKIKNTIEKSGYNGHFIFPGLDCDSDVYYAGAHIYALTSREDPFPSVVLEALDALIPVVAFTESGGAADLLSKGCGVLVDEMNSQAFSSALIELIDDPERIHQLGQEGKKIIDEEFSFRKYLFDLSSLAHTGLQRVSVVVPNYNYEQYIQERLQSIFDQSYPIYEIIILDDCSSDSSIRTIVKIIQDQAIDCKLIVNANNSGNVFKQWAKGAELAKGDYIWIAEADDLANIDFLNEVIKPFVIDKEVVLSFCQSVQMNEHGEELCPDYLDYVSDISRDKWRKNYINDGIDEIGKAFSVKNTIPNVSAVVFSRSAITFALCENLSEIMSFTVAGDWLVYIYALTQGKIAFSSKALNKHRRHSNSVTLGKFNISLLKEIALLQKKVRDEFMADDTHKKRAHDYLNELYEQFGLKTHHEPSIDKCKLLEPYL